jgi:exosome complex component RRP4
MMSMRNIVTPGELIAPAPVMVKNAYIEGGKTYSKVLGMYDGAGRGIIPLEGAWCPTPEDTVVGMISEVKNKVYVADLSYFGRSLIVPGKYDEYNFSEGDIIAAKIKDVESRRTVILKEAELLEGGTLIRVKPKKVLRIIGKKDTMISQIAALTKTQIVVGMNGIIWLRGGNLALATEAIFRVEREAHTSGLTETIKLFLETKSV